jgi:enoyl-CoA hydratase/carnithine racemase
VAILSNDLIVEEIGPIMRATLNRPDKLNALNRAIFEGLTDAVAEYARRDDLRVFLIRSTGRYFCAGADLVGGDPGPTQGGTAPVREWYRTGMGPGMIALYDRMESIEKPFVVAHHAPCVGGGLELSLSCDFRLAAKSARYLFPETKLGSIPAAGGVSRFTRLCGPQWTKWILMADQPISAERALMIGLVQDVYEDGEFEERVMRFCENLAGKPPEMMAMAKRVIDLVTDVTPERARQIEILGQSMLHIGDEAKAMLSAMHQKLGRK